MQRNILNTYCQLKSLQKLYVHTIPFLPHSSYSTCHCSPTRCKYSHAFIRRKYERYVLHISSTRKIYSTSNRSSKEKSKVEETVESLKEEKEKSTSKLPESLEGTVPDSHTKASSAVVTKPKRSIWKRIKDEIIHYYHGFRLLFIDVKVASRMIWKILHGEELSRRENKQLVRTSADIFRLVPFSVFILVPFMELLLPVFIKLFPQMLPSTFETSSEKEKKFKSQLKLKIEMAKFLQNTLDELSVHAKGEAHSHTAKEFATFFEKIRSTGEVASNEDILKYCKLFEDELTLDNLPRPSLIALCRLLELQPIGTNNLLRFQLRMRLRNLKLDDKMIMKEGIDSLTVPELQAACRARGMRALGMPEDRLKDQLQQWLELSLDEQIPPSLLLLSRALYLPENLPAPDQLKATLSTLPETATTEAKYKIGEIEGKVDNKTKLELIKKEEAAIKKEAEEMVQEKLDKQKEAEKLEAAATDTDVKEKVVSFDKAPVLEDKAPIIDTAEANKEKEFSKEDIDDLEDALENIANEKKKLIIEKEELEDLKEEMADYKQDIEELKDMVLETGHKELSESKAALRLSNKVNKMISKMNNLLEELTVERKSLQQQIDSKDKEGISASKERDDIISINELVLAIRRIQKVSDDTRLQRIADVLQKMDVDHDGSVEVDHVLKVIELLGQENVNVSDQQMNEIIDLLMKEDTLETEEKIQKQKEIEENMPKNKSEERLS